MSMVMLMLCYVMLCYTTVNVMLMSLMVSVNVVVNAND